MTAAGRGIGWEALRVAVDGAFRLAYTEFLPEKKKESAIACRDRALAGFAPRSVAVENLPCLQSHFSVAAVQNR
jgi:hypothetical protein